MDIYNNYFGTFGGRYVGEVLRSTLDALEHAYIDAMHDNDFVTQLKHLQQSYIGRPTPLLYAQNTSKEIGGAHIYIKQEGLAATGAHKINNALGQVLLAKRMGKTRIIAETGAGQHGVAVAATCAKLHIECCIYMGSVDIARQRPNVVAMELYGATVIAVDSGSKTLKDAVNAALRDWAASNHNTQYVIGSALGPSPFPDMVREFQSVVGKEVVEQLQSVEQPIEALVACVGGGSNAIGFFAPFIEQKSPRLIGVEAGGRGSTIGDHAVRMNGTVATSIVHGYKSKFLVNTDGQVQSTHSISAGLDYPGIGPQLAHLGDTGRIEFQQASDDATLHALKYFAKHEGVLFALESAHAGAYALQLASTLSSKTAIVLMMSGRGDKDIFITAKYLQPQPWLKFLKEEVADLEQHK